MRTAVLAILLAFASQAVVAVAEEMTFSVEIAPDLQPRMTPEHVSQRVLNLLASPIRAVGKDVEGRGQVDPQPPRIVAMKCIPGEGFVSYYDQTTQETYTPEAIWFVEATGRFPPKSGALGAAVPVRNRGIYAIDDSDGRVVMYAPGGQLPSSDSSPE